MSQKENHWYLLGNYADTLRNSTRLRPRQLVFSSFGAVVVVGAAFAAAETGLTESLDLESNSISYVAAIFVGVLLFWTLRYRSLRARHAKALQHADPEELIDLIVQSMGKAWALPDIDAHSSSSRAEAYALYGRGEEAARALAEVNWGAKAPLVQAIGLATEGIVELLCRRNVERALELNEKARAIASLGRFVPGATQSRRSLGAHIGVCEALLRTESPTNLEWLEEAAADNRYPRLRVLAAFGLAVAMENAGNAERASQLRAFLQQAAPHCAPLQLGREEFFAGGRGSTFVLPAPVSLSIASANAAPGAYERSAKTKVLVFVAVVVALYGGVILLNSFIVPLLLRGLK